MKKGYLLFSLLSLLLITLISLNVGVVHVNNALSALFGSGDSSDVAIIQNIRAPRIFAGLLVGSALGIAGALSQGALRNPLAEPVLLGTTGGSAFFTLLGILFFNVSLATPASLLLGISGALFATLITYRIGRNGRGGFSFVITGIAMSSVLTALVGIAAIMINKPSAQGVTFWSLGTLSMSTSHQILLLLPILLITSCLAFIIAPKLDYLALGDIQARHLGVDVGRIRLSVFLLVSISIGATTSIFGQIAFLALAIPHIVRGLIGVQHRVVVLHSAILGATLLTTSDLIARTAATPNELPLGLMTALLGAPVLIGAAKRGLASHG